MLEGLAGVLDVTFVSKLLHPGHPFLHHLLHFLRRPPAFGTAIKIDKLAHGKSSLVCFSDSKTFEAHDNGHFFQPKLKIRPGIRIVAIHMPIRASHFLNKPPYRSDPSASSAETKR